jgi:hypothetical protein
MGRVVGRPLGSRSKGIIELVSSAFFFLALVGQWVWVMSILGLWEIGKREKQNIKKIQA